MTKRSRKTIKGENIINIILSSDYQTRLERAKLEGRLFYNSLDPSLKKLPIDVNAIINAHSNWSFLVKDLYDEDGYTIFKYKKKKKKFLICIDQFAMVERKRFTVSHEIGHIVLGHFEEYYMKTLTPYEEYVLDKEADMVAGELLMPYDHMLEYYNWSTKGLTNRFHVSKEAAQVRLDILNKDFMFLRDIGKYDDTDELNNFLSLVNNYY